MSQALYRKWRPGQWNQVIGQEHIVQTLQNAIRSGRVGHAYLFSGPRGTGKTTMARLLAKAVNCLDENPSNHPCNQCQNCQTVNNGNFLDLIEIDAASNTSVDDIRDLRDKINFSPSQGKFKVYIIDEVHMLSTAAFNALLKTLEEPPAHAIFILATTEVHKIPATVLSRCQRHEFRRIPVNDIVHYLEEMVKAEGLAADTEALVLIARQSTGCMRDAISLLDQLSSLGEKITLSIAQNVLGTAPHQSVFELVNALLDGNTAAGIDSIHKALDSGSDPRQFARQVVEYLRSLLLIQLDSADQVDSTTEQRVQMADHARRFERLRLLNCIRLFNNTVIENRGTWQPNLLLELALVESIEIYKNPPAEPAAMPEKRPDTQANIPLPVKQETKPVMPTIGSTVNTPNPPPPLAQSGPITVSKNGVTIEDIIKAWGQIRLAIKKRSPQTEALLNSCKPLTLKEGVLFLGFASDVVKSKMESNDNKDLTSQVISQLLGVQIPIQCTVMGNKVSIDPVDLGIEGGGLVNTALNLGGKIVNQKKSSHS